MTHFFFRTVHWRHELRNLLPTNSWQSLREVSESFWISLISQSFTFHFSTDSFQRSSGWILEIQPVMDSTTTVFSKYKRLSGPKTSSSFPMPRQTTFHPHERDCSAVRALSGKSLRALRPDHSLWHSIQIRFMRQPRKLDSECNTKLFKHFGGSLGFY